MSISLEKGQKVDLTKGNPGLTEITIGLGWDINKYDGGSAFDLDASAFCVGADGKTKSEGFVFYGQGHHEAPGVKYGGDNTTGAGDGDDERIYIDLNKVPQDIQKIAIAVTIYQAEQRGQKFGQVSNAYVRVVSGHTDAELADKSKELVYFDLGEDFDRETAIVTAEVYRHNGEWKFNAIGQGFQGGLKALAQNYGLDV